MINRALDTVNNHFRKFIVSGLVVGLLACYSGTLHAAPTAAPKLKPVATCADGGTYSNVSGEHRGACSGHGGVVAWADGSPVASKAGRTSSYAAPKGKK